MITSASIAGSFNGRWIYSEIELCQGLQQDAAGLPANECECQAGKGWADGGEPSLNEEKVVY